MHCNRQVSLLVEMLLATAMRSFIDLMCEFRFVNPVLVQQSYSIEEDIRTLTPENCIHNID
jgi:hypothetical protein